MTESPICRLYSLAATLTKTERDGSVSIQVCHGIRGAYDGKDAVVGRFVPTILKKYPGYALAIEVAVMEVTHDAMRSVLSGTAVLTDD